MKEDYSIARVRQQMSRQLQPKPAKTVHDAWLERRIKLVASGQLKSFSEEDRIGNSTSATTNTTNNNTTNNNNQTNPKHLSAAGLPDWVIQGLQQQQQNDIIAAANTSTNETANNGTNEYKKFIECQDFDHSFRQPTHGCQRNRDTKMVHCAFENFRVDVSRIISDRGGEPLESVMERSEEREFPKYKHGAFATATKPMHVPLPEDKDLPLLHYMLSVLDSMDFPTNETKTKNFTCAETWNGTTMFITRYEYANLYHTMTDWWNTYFSLPPNKTKVQIVFLDGHAQGNLDPFWETVFGKTTYVQHLPKGGVCFERAILIPPGYAAPIYPKWNRARCVSLALATEFSNHVLRQYGLQNVHMIPGKVVIINRSPYISHPRSKAKNFRRIINNMDKIRDELLKFDTVFNVEMVSLERLPIGEQIKKVREANILIGYHGAGLTHALFLDDNATVVELSNSMVVDFFVFLSEWRGLRHSVVASVDESGILPDWNIQNVARVVSNILGTE